MDDSKILILGANGQLGQELHRFYPNAKSTDVSTLDITNSESVINYNWNDIEIVINAAAYTNVDGAETEQGRIDAWRINAVAVANLALAANKNDFTLFHISTDYVFDGSKNPHTEDEDFSPLSVYGASKAAGDIATSTAKKYYILRTSWVIGEGKNFVRTMIELGKKSISPSVVSDQIGRLTFTSELVRAIDHLLINKVPFGTYNISNEGEPVSWAAITRKIFKLANYNNTVTDTSTAEYFAGKEGIAPRPLFSILDLGRIHSTKFISRNWEDDLVIYVEKELK